MAKNKRKVRDVDHKVEDSWHPQKGPWLTFSLALRCPCPSRRRLSSYNLCRAWTFSLCWSSQSCLSSSASSWSSCSRLLCTSALIWRAVVRACSRTCTTERTRSVKVILLVSQTVFESVFETVNVMKGYTNTMCLTSFCIFHLCLIEVLQDPPDTTALWHEHKYSAKATRLNNYNSQPRFQHDLDLEFRSAANNVKGIHETKDEITIANILVLCLHCYYPVGCTLLHGWVWFKCKKLIPWASTNSARCSLMRIGHIHIHTWHF